MVRLGLVGIILAFLCSIVGEALSHVGTTFEADLCTLMCIIKALHDLHLKIVIIKVFRGQYGGLSVILYPFRIFLRIC